MAYQRLTYQDKIALRQTAQALGINPGALLTVILFETGAKVTKDQGVLVDAAAANPGSSAEGVLQFMEDTSPEVGYERGGKMSFYDQVKPYGPVHTYLYQHGVKPGMDLERIYRAVHAGNPYGNATDGVSKKDTTTIFNNDVKPWETRGNSMLYELDPLNPTHWYLPALPAIPEPTPYDGVNPALMTVVARAQELLPPGVGLGVFPTSGKRTEAQQAALVKAGWSKTMNSDHRDGDAIDLVPTDSKGAPLPDDLVRYSMVEQAMKQASKELGVEVEWGGDWSDFKDRPHWAVKPGTQLAANQLRVPKIPTVDYNLKATQELVAAGYPGVTLAPSPAMVATPRPRGQGVQTAETAVPGGAPVVPASFTTPLPIAGAPRPEPSVTRTPEQFFRDFKTGAGGVRTHVMRPATNAEEAGLERARTTRTQVGLAFAKPRVEPEVGLSFAATQEQTQGPIRVRLTPSARAGGGAPGVNVELPKMTAVPTPRLRESAIQPAFVRTPPDRPVAPNRATVDAVPPPTAASDRRPQPPRPTPRPVRLQTRPALTFPIRNPDAPGRVKLQLSVKTGQPEGTVVQGNALQAAVPTPKPRPSPPLTFPIRNPDAPGIQRLEPVATVGQTEGLSVELPRIRLTIAGQQSGGDAATNVPEQNVGRGTSITDATGAPFAPPIGPEIRGPQPGAVSGVETRPTEVRHGIETTFPARQQPISSQSQMVMGIGVPRPTTPVAPPPEARTKDDAEIPRSSISTSPAPAVPAPGTVTTPPPPGTAAPKPTVTPAPPAVATPQPVVPVTPPPPASPPTLRRQQQTQPIRTTSTTYTKPGYAAPGQLAPAGNNVLGPVRPGSPAIATSPSGGAASPYQVSQDSRGNNVVSYVNSHGETVHVYQDPSTMGGGFIHQGSFTF